MEIFQVIFAVATILFFIIYVMPVLFAKDYDTMYQCWVKTPA